MKKLVILIGAMALMPGAYAQVTDTGNNVGIGNAAPAHKLDVNGNLNISTGNALLIGGNQVVSTGGSRNMFLGDGTGSNISTGGDNAIIGFKAAEYLSTGRFNTVIGFKAGQNMTSELSNTIIGREAGKNNIGNQNVLIGRQSGESNEGGENTFIGDRVGLSNTTGTTNTLIGSNSDVGSAGLTNATAIGAGAVVSSSNAVILGSGANVGIGTSSPLYDLDVNGDINLSGDLYKNGVLFAGAEGPTGPAGSIGNTGPQGPQGPTGPLVSGTTNQTLRYNGSSWEAAANLKNNGNTVNIGTSNTSSTSTKLHAAATVAGASGISNTSLLDVSGTQTVGSSAAMRINNYCTGTSSTHHGLYNQVHGTEGHHRGVYHYLTGATSGSKYGGYAVLSSGTGSSYGFYGYSLGSGINYGIYGRASGGTTNWAGYFNGSTYSTGTYQGSDIKLKRNVSEIESATDIVTKLNPQTYEFKTDEYAELHLEKGQRYGFIAHELKEVLPQFVKANKQEVYSDPDKDGHQELIETIEFDVVNYTEFIPILTKAIQEQQEEIESLKAVRFENEGLKGRLDRMEEMMRSFGTDLQQCCFVSSAAETINNGGDQDQTIIDDEAVLEQNIPNPFRENTVIKYYLPEGTISAQMQISDLNGNLLKSFNLQGKGFGQVLITGGSFKAGTYIYSLIINGNRVNSKRMMLL